MIRVKVISHREMLDMQSISRLHRMGIEIRRSKILTLASKALAFEMKSVSQDTIILVDASSLLEKDFIMFSHLMEGDGRSRVAIVDFDNVLKKPHHARWIQRIGIGYLDTYPRLEVYLGELGQEIKVSTMVAQWNSELSDRRSLRRLGSERRSH